jgi:hypothetical protein
MRLLRVNNRAWVTAKLQKEEAPSVEKESPSQRKKENIFLQQPSMQVGLFSPRPSLFRWLCSTLIRYSRDPSVAARHIPYVDDLQVQESNLRKL